MLRRMFWLLMAMMVWPAEAGYCDIIIVRADGTGAYITVQAAIDAAGPDDEVVLEAGTFTGSGNRDINFKGKAITVRSVDPYDPSVVAATVIDCNGIQEGFDFTQGEGQDSVLAGVTVTNGLHGISFSYNSNPTILNCVLTGNGKYLYNGGGIYCRDSSPTIENCHIADNYVSCSQTNGRGGGVYCWNSPLTIINCTITDNTGRYGGGVYCYNSNITMTDCTISNNDNTGPPYSGYGAGIYFDWASNGIISNCQITGNGNTQVTGGGVYCDDSSPTIINCTISDNDGWGLKCDDDSSPDVINCTITNNWSNGYGCGVICTGRSNPTITNCLIANNEAQYRGGGVYCFYSPTFINCTIAYNQAGQYGAGIYAGSGSSVTFHNSIVWHNTGSPNIYGAPIITYSNIQGGYGGAGNIDFDPLFIDPNGPDDDPDTWDDNNYRLSTGSPCIDAADNTAVPPDVADLDNDANTAERTPFDRDGKTRFLDDPSTADTGLADPPDYPQVVDMGAYEFGEEVLIGNFDGDGDVDFYDFAIFGSAWRTKSGDDNWNPACDISQPADNFVDTADLAVYIKNWLASIE